MATDREFIVNKKFFIGIVVLAVLVTGVNLYTSLAPKNVTVYVKSVEQSYQVERPLKIVLPDLNR